jgi:hypothetical protein
MEPNKENYKYIILPVHNSTQEEVNRIKEIIEFIYSVVKSDGKWGLGTELDINDKLVLFIQASSEDPFREILDKFKDVKFEIKDYSIS